MLTRPWVVSLRLALFLGLLLGAMLGLGSCSQLGYYQQAVGGQMRLLAARKPIEEVVADPGVDARLRQRLQTAQRMLSFLHTELHLQPQKRYQTYVALDRSAVVYNLVATPYLSVEPHQWCYPVVGCAPYRGYFAAEAAQRASERYQAQGLTTTVGEVPAYSTLGWFDDPLLSSFIYWPDAELVNLLAHEVSHSKLWIPSDVAFNEAFASFVGTQAALQWLELRQPADLVAYQKRQQAWTHLRAMLLQLRKRLQSIYAEPLSDDAKLAQQEQAYAQLRACYAEQRGHLGGERFDAYMGRLNNAGLAALATYDNFRPAFARLFAQVQGRWPEFYAAAERFKPLAPEVRQQRLAELAEEEVTGERDHHNPNKIECQPLADHGLDAKTVGAVDNYVRRGGHREHEGT